jgi:hypothetical protein
MMKFEKTTRKFKVSSTDCIMTFIQETPHTISILSSAAGGWSSNSKRYTNIDEAIKHYTEQAPILVDGYLTEIFD